MKTASQRHAVNEEVEIRLEGVVLRGTLEIPANARGIVLFAHGSGSGRLSPRNRAVAAALREHDLGTLLFDLFTRSEEEEDRFTGHLRFDLPLLADRLVATTQWLSGRFPGDHPPVGYFGASTGGGAALLAASRHPDRVDAVVSRGGRPDLVQADDLRKVKAATLLLVGGEDHPVIAMNEAALRHLRSTKELVIVPGATHLFEEPGTLDEVAQRATTWFTTHLGS